MFRDAMTEIGLEMPAAARIAHTLERGARGAGRRSACPPIIRPSFTLGGTGGGIAYNREEFEQIVPARPRASPITEVLIEESVLGWKEYEMEVVRDRADNCVIICSIENIDPMGVHTGDSITVAPAQTLTDKEYQRMRDASIACLREIGVETGGSNIQFAVNPADGRMVVIEMNPRVSRSSALASKATGFPIAKIAAKLAVGYTLDELANDITRVTPACFEPTIDYVVDQDPALAFEKFPGRRPLLTTPMKSVGEAMAIGRTFEEALQKALRSHGDRLDRPRCDRAAGRRRPRRVPRRAVRPAPDRLLHGRAQAMRAGLSVEDIHDAANTIRGSCARSRASSRPSARSRRDGLPRRRRRAAAAQGARLLRRAAGRARRARPRRRSPRCAHALGVRPVFKRIDTCAAEFASARPTCIRPTRAATATPACEADPTDRRKVMILGGGPNRIGQGIEFDYCCVHAAFALREAGFETIMVNCNPETVCTDYDTSDRLYFEPLTAEDVLAWSAREQPTAASRLHRPVRRPDAAEAVARPRARRHPDPRHPRRRDRPRRGPRAIPAAAHGSACASRTTASRGRPRKPRPSPSASAIRC